MLCMVEVGESMDDGNNSGYEVSYYEAVMVVMMMMMMERENPRRQQDIPWVLSGTRGQRRYPSGETRQSPRPLIIRITVVYISLIRGDPMGSCHKYNINPDLRSLAKRPFARANG